MATTPPTRPALRRRYDRRQERVIQVAAELFAERGYDATSMTDLSDATGLAAGGLYHYIGSKKQLLFRICDELMEPLLEEARAIVATDAPADVQLRDLLRAWLEHIARHRHHMMVFQQERHLIERDPQWRTVRRQRKDFELILDDVLRRCELRGNTQLSRPRARPARPARDGQPHSLLAAPAWPPLARADRRRLPGAPHSQRCSRVRSSTGKNDSTRISWRVMSCGVPTVVTIEK